MVSTTATLRCRSDAGAGIRGSSRARGGVDVRRRVAAAGNRDAQRPEIVPTQK